ncbi:MAG: threonine--tRNA ligase [Candidatus Omnitrophota bacterium]
MDIETLRHSCSHILASAVKELWPDVKLGIGPAIEDGFYYDFDRKEPFTEEDLLAIDKKMREIISRNEPFRREEMKRQDALKLFQERKEDYKVELISAITDEVVSLYRTGEGFVDLCRGPHLHSTGEVKAFKLLSLAGAYWHGIETNPMLQRIYGTAFFTQEELEDYLRNLDEAKLRDHRKIGPALGLFDIFHEEAGAGLVFYHPKGAILRKIIEDYEKEEHIKRGYQMVITPHIMHSNLWRASGHYDYYKDNMYVFGVDNAEYVLKPMNCPGHILIYKSKTRSYKELPIRLFELGTVYRHEKAGVLHGLLRVRGFTQDDAHIFCLPQQLREEIKGVIDFVFDTMKAFGFNEWAIELSTQPKDHIGSDEDWEVATGALKEALQDKDLQYDINEGDGAFYGPKIDIKLKDALKRQWQCATIQCDFALPKRFGLSYIDKEGKEALPIMVHRVLLGSIERFIGALVEHYNGDFPLWLAPVQVLIIPIREGVFEYSSRVEKSLRDEGLRVGVDMRNETLDKKIRNSEMEKIPYTLVIGDREESTGLVAVRRKGKGNLGTLSLQDFIKKVKGEIKEKSVFR